MMGRIFKKTHLVLVGALTFSASFHASFGGFTGLEIYPPSADETLPAVVQLKGENDSLSSSVVQLKRRENEHNHHRPPPNSTICPVNGVGIEGKGGKQVLEKIRKGVVAAKKELLKSKILCMIYTNEHGHDSLHAQFHTWARQCDGFIGASNLTDPSIGAIDLPHDGPESYGNMWQKIRSMWAYAHSNHYRDYDYFHIGGDDMYVVVENLRAYLDGPFQPLQKKTLSPKCGSQTIIPKPGKNDRFCLAFPCYTGDVHSLPVDPAIP
jgi:hypothetical protein